jgi:peptide/nickel transport system ATP-binding protein
MPDVTIDGSGAGPAGAHRASSALRLEDVTVHYGAGTRRRRVLDRVSLTVGTGEIVGLIGETGSGKSTVARAALGSVPSTGSVHVGDTLVSDLDRAERRAFRRTGTLQYVFQDPLQSLDPARTVGGSIAEGPTVAGWDRDRVRTAVAEALAAVGLPAEFGARLPGSLSGGQRQRVAIARALVQEPDVVILDESVSALDAANRIQVLDLLRRIRDDRGLAQLFISHDLGSVAGIADRIVVLYRGTIVEQGPVEQVVGDPQHAYTRLLIGSAPTLTGGAGRIGREERLALRAELTESGVAGS